MRTNIIFICIFLLLGSLAVSIPAIADETDLFTTAIPPDALIILDRSGSMADTPAGVYPPPNSGSACLTSPNDNCSKLNIAKAAIFNIMDYVKNGTINLSDSQGMNVRFGYMRYTESSGNTCSPERAGNLSYSSGCNVLVDALEANNGAGSYYQTIICGNTSKTGSCSLTGAPSGDSVLAATANGGTPLAASLAEALIYMNFSKSSDTKAGDCRKKFVILITDGEDTYACNGDGTASQSNMNWRRQSVVARAKALYDAGYMVYVIGFGANQSDALKYSLNWAAYYGGTDNPNAVNTGDKNAYTPPTITPNDNTCTGSDDPANYPLDGYAFIATNTAELSTALQSAISQIRESSYSFSEPYIALARTASENFIYQASFTPFIQPNDPFWEGHLQRYSIDSQGNVSGTSDWDAGQVLQTTGASNRKIFTLIDGTVTTFEYDNVSAAKLGVQDDCSRRLAISYFRGESSLPRDYNNAGCNIFVTNPDNRKLGDIFGSNLTILGTPYESFSDILDVNNAFAEYRSLNERTTDNPNHYRLILAGANDGQLHAFRTQDGAEIWSFIPPNSLPNLINVAHSTHTTSKQHTYMVDGPITTSDVWICDGSGCDNTHKSASQWHSIIVFGLGKGNKNFLWSSSASCDSNFATAQGQGGTEPPYSATYPYYCGYYGFEDTASSTSGDQKFDSTSITTTPPLPMWTIGTYGDAADAPYLGQPWSKMVIGRIKINGQEKWVGFIGGGYNSVQPQGQNTSDKRGRGIFVIDIKDGSIIKAFTLGGNNPTSEMIYAIAAPPEPVDTDADAFIDRVYIGDLGGNMWRVKLCANNSGSSCNQSDWTASKLYDASSSGNIRPIYTNPVLAYDELWNLWVFWGTGDMVNPTDPNAQEQFYAIKDGGSATYTFSDFQNITTGTYDGVSQGWRILMNGHGEKMLGAPALLGGHIYFTTFTPVQGGGSNLCSQGGSSALYGLNSATGAGILGNDNSRSETLSGSGVASAPYLSSGPEGTSLYLTVSSGTAQKINDANLVTPVSMRNIRAIRDRRTQQ